MLMPGHYLEHFLIQPADLEVAAALSFFFMDPNDVKVESIFDVDEVNSVEYELLLDD